MSGSSQQDEDVKVLHGMGYSQELLRRMGGFQNFAISRPGRGDLAVLGGGVLIFVGFQPPYELVGKFFVGTVVVLTVIWFSVERARFRGPPISEADVASRQASIAAEEAALERP
jgi:hypothetical protein